MREDIKNYLKDPKYSCLLMGQTGLPLEEDAMQMASSILKATNKQLLRHPDFMSVDSGKDKTIGVEKVAEILAKASLVPALGEKIVVVIKEFDKLTEQAQNMLLKLIEESGTVLIIGTCYQDNILETIKSRCSLFYYKPYTKEQFEEYCKEKGIADSALLYYLTNGCPGLCNENTEVLNCFKAVAAAIESGKYTDLLATLHLLEEKDKDNFYMKYPSHVKQLLRLLANLFQKKWVLEPSNSIYKTICCILNENIMSCSKVSYTKDNFFYLFAQIITITTKEEGGESYGSY